jgi:hypothetical protein
MVVAVKIAGKGRASNLPKKDNAPVLAAVRKLYIEIVEGDGKASSKKTHKAGKWKDFANRLRRSLDVSFEPHWHVLVGQSFGFHCKSVKMAQFVISGCKDLKSSESLTVIIWKSPGSEPLTSESEASPKTDGSSSAAENPSEDSKPEETSDSRADEPGNASSSSRFHLLHPVENEIEAGSEIEKTVHVLRDVLQSEHPKDTADLAKHVRKCLTEKVGTIWHVIIGDYVLDHAEDCEVSVTASFGKDGKITCFRHAQIAPKLIDWTRIASAIPYAILVFVCSSYVAFHTICNRGNTDTDSATPEPIKAKGWFTQAVENNICSKPDWDTELGVIAVITVVSSFVAKRLLRKYKA